MTLILLEVLISFLEVLLLLTLSLLTILIYILISLLLLILQVLHLLQVRFDLYTMSLLQLFTLCLLVHNTDPQLLNLLLSVVKELLHHITIHLDVVSLRLDL